MIFQHSLSCSVKSRYSVQFSSQLAPEASPKQPRRTWFKNLLSNWLIHCQFTVLSAQSFVCEFLIGPHRPPHSQLLPQANCNQDTTDTCLWPRRSPYLGISGSSQPISKPFSSSPSCFPSVLLPSIKTVLAATQPTILTFGGNKTFYPNKRNF